MRGGRPAEQPALLSPVQEEGIRALCDQEQGKAAPWPWLGCRLPANTISDYLAASLHPVTLAYGAALRKWLSPGFSVDTACPYGNHRHRWLWIHYLLLRTLSSVESTVSPPNNSFPESSGSVSNSLHESLWTSHLLLTRTFSSQPLPRPSRIFPCQVPIMPWADGPGWILILLLTSCMILGMSTDFSELHFCTH